MQCNSITDASGNITAKCFFTSYQLVRSNKLSRALSGDLDKLIEGESIARVKDDRFSITIEVGSFIGVPFDLHPLPCVYSM